MIAIVLLGLLALSSAAPRYQDHGYHGHGHHEHGHRDHGHHGHQDFNPFESQLGTYMEQEMFNTRRFWDDLRREMMDLDRMLSDLGERFPSTVSNEKIEGDNYIIIVNLLGYLEKEIVVKARKGLLIIQATHKAEGEDQRNYLDVRSLPDCVNESGSWTFQNGVLKVTFPLVKSQGTESAITELPNHSREDVEANENGDRNEDADVGADGNGNHDVDESPDRGDLAPNRDILTNEIPKQNTVEATTYAVDLKDDVELLPVQYK